jgi:hypothetical protein
MNQDMIDRYISGSMSESDAQAFEEHCLANPEFARVVEYEQRLKIGIAQVASGSTAEFVRSETPLRWSLAAAAGVLIALTSVFYVWSSSHTLAPTIMAEVVDSRPVGDASMRLALVRGSDSIPTLPAGLVRVEIVGLFEAGNVYSVALDRREQNQKIDTIATLNDQHPSSPMSLDVLIDSKQLRSGSYSLRVRKQGSGEEALDFGFQKP